MAFWPEPVQAVARLKGKNNYLWMLNPFKSAPLPKLLEIKEFLTMKSKSGLNFKK